MSWRLRDSDDFAVAGRGLGPAVLAGTLVATWTGTAGLLGGAEADATGLSRALLPVGALAGMLLLVVLGPAVRAVPAQTLPQVLGVKFGGAARRESAGSYLTFIPGSAPLSGLSMKMPGFSPDAASTMPSESPNFILRGARLATITVSRPTSAAGS